MSILSGNITYPPHLSKDCCSCIKKLLNSSPTNRPTLKDLQDDDWFTRRGNVPFVVTTEEISTDRLLFPSKIRRWSTGGSLNKFDNNTTFENESRSLNEVEQIYDKKINPLFHSKSNSWPNNLSREQMLLTRKTLLNKHMRKVGNVVNL